MNQILYSLLGKKPVIKNGIEEEELFTGVGWVIRFSANQNSRRKRKPTFNRLEMRLWGTR